MCNWTWLFPWTSNTFPAVFVPNPGCCNKGKKWLQMTCQSVFPKDVVWNLTVKHSEVEGMRSISKGNLS